MELLSEIPVLTRPDFRVPRDGISPTFAEKGTREYAALTDLRIFGPGLIGQMIANARRTAGHPYDLIGRYGVIESEGQPSSSPHIVVAVKCDQIGEVVSGCGDAWHSAETRILATNGLPERQLNNDFQFDAAIILGVGVSRSADNELHVVTASVSVIVPLKTPFSSRVLARLQTVAADLTKSGVPTEVLNDVAHGRELRFKKLFQNAVANPLSALLGQPMAQLAGQQALKPIIAGITEEFNSVAAAEKVRFRGTVADAITFLTSGRNHFPSTAIDVFRRRRSEIGFLNGALVAIATEHGFDVRLNALLVKLVRGGVHLSANALNTLANFVIPPPAIALAA